MILIRKGITTYEYVVAMKERSEARPGTHVDEQFANIMHLPSVSANTGYSGGSSLGLHYRGPWCTPPGVLVDYQEGVMQTHDEETKNNAYYILHETLLAGELQESIKKTVERLIDAQDDLVEASEEQANSVSYMIAHATK